LQQLGVDLLFYLEDVGPISVFAVEHRVKTYDSALAKAQKLHLTIEQLYDIAGLRIVVGSEPEVAVAKYFFRLKEHVKDLTIRREWVVEHPDGYRATHMVVTFSGHYTRSVFPVELEIQIPTIIEHAFNFLSHAWTYKAPRAPGSEWQKAFRGIAQELRRVDEKLASLQEGAIVAKRADESAKLTPFAYREIAREMFGEDVPIDDAVDNVRQLTDLGASTNQQLSAFFARPDIAEAWEKFMRLSERGSSFAKSMTESRVLFWQVLGLRMSMLDNWVALAEKEVSSGAQNAG
jgi:ppGpp synthetase/RelA/SpoT-type nucleotidyltranferase